MAQSSGPEIVIALLGMLALAAASSSFTPDVYYTTNSTGEMCVSAVINITYKDKNNDTHTELPGIGKYGQGLVGSAHGQLVHVMSASNSTPYPPEGACTYPLVPVRSGASLPTGPWIALIRRGHCSFDEKFHSAFLSGASAVIVYNDRESDTLDKMKLSPIGNITAILTHKRKGEEMARLVDSGTVVTTTIGVAAYRRCSSPINRTSVLFVSASFVVLMVISLVWLVFYYVQRFRYIHAKDRLSRQLCSAAKKALSKIPTKNIKADDKEVNGDGECCPVCIDPYKVMDVIRILPCRHEFHKSCIDPWLLDHRTCPMCKMDILRYYGFVLTGSQESILQLDAEEVATLTLPQLRSSLYVTLPPESAARSAEQPTSSATTPDNALARECPA